MDNSSSSSSSSSSTVERERERESTKRNYTLVRLVGQGTFGKVFEAIDEKKRRVAIKRVEKSTQFISREVEILRMVSHPNCLSLLDVFHTYSEDEPPKMYQNLVFDFFPFTLSAILKKRRLSLPCVKQIFYQLCMACNHIHSKRICHRDITPNNILLSARGEVKLADFGSAKVLEDDHVSMSYICSRYYRAPELLLGSTNYTTRIDVWSVGCILAEMLIGKPLFPGTDSQDQFIKIVLVLGTPSIGDLWAMKKNYKQNLKFPRIEPLPFVDVLPDMEEEELAADLLSQMLSYNPKKRPTIEDVLMHPFLESVRSQGDAWLEELKMPADTVAASSTSVSTSTVEALV